MINPNDAVADPADPVDPATDQPAVPAVHLQRPLGVVVETEAPGWLSGLTPPPTALQPPWCRSLPPETATCRCNAADNLLSLLALPFDTTGMA